MSANPAEPITPEWPATPPTTLDEGDPGNELPTAGASRAPARRLFLPVACSLLILGALAAAVVWLQYQATHVVTRNALVRSHLSQIGVRGEGVIAQILVNAGDEVRAGDVLARLDDRHLLAQRAQIEASLLTLDQRIAVDEAALQFAREKAQVTLIRAQSEYRQMQAEAQAARVQAEDSKAFHAARQALEPGGAISAEVIRDAAAKAAMQAALAAAADAAADAGYSELQAAKLAQEEIIVREGELRVLRAQRQESLAALKRVDVDIQSTRVTAPADGAVVRRLAQPGMAVSTGMPLLSLWLTEESWIEAWIPEERIGDLQIGSDVRVSFPSLPDAWFSGRLERIGLATDFEMPIDYLPQTRETRMRPTPQIGVLVRLEAPPETVRPGMSAIVDIQRG